MGKSPRRRASVVGACNTERYSTSGLVCLILNATADNKFAAHRETEQRSESPADEANARGDGTQRLATTGTSPHSAPHRFSHRRSRTATTDFANTTPAGTPNQPQGTVGCRRSEGLQSPAIHHRAAPVGTGARQIADRSPQSSPGDVALSTSATASTATQRHAQVDPRISGTESVPGGDAASDPTTKRPRPQHERHREHDNAKASASRPAKGRPQASPAGGAARDGASRATSVSAQAPLRVGPRAGTRKSTCGRAARSRCPEAARRAERHRFQRERQCGHGSTEASATRPQNGGPRSAPGGGARRRGDLLSVQVPGQRKAPSVTSTEGAVHVKLSWSPLLLLR